MSTALAGLMELSRAAGLDLAAYRGAHVAGRVRRAVERERVTGVDQLTRLLATDAAARARFRQSVAISVTGLFRDRPQFDLLERELLPPLVERPGRVTVWSAGCSNGSELYSVGILLERLGALDRAVLTGSDVLEENVALARRGVYGNVEIADAIRRRARFEVRDVLRDPPTGVFRLVLCRNLAIYLEPRQKLALHRLLASALVPRGVLLLGRSERISDADSLGLQRVGPHAYRRAA